MNYLRELGMFLKYVEIQKINNILQISKIIKLLKSVYNLNYTCFLSNFLFMNVSDYMFMNFLNLFYIMSIFNPQNNLREGHVCLHLK